MEEALGCKPVLYLTSLRIDGREQWWRWEDQLGGYFTVQVRGDDSMMAQTRGRGDQKGWDTGCILDTECTGFPDSVDVEYEGEKKNQHDYEIVDLSNKKDDKSVLSWRMVEVKQVWGKRSGV